MTTRIADDNTPSQPTCKRKSASQTTLKQPYREKLSSLPISKLHYPSVRSYNTCLQLTSVVSVACRAYQTTLQRYIFFSIYHNYFARLLGGGGGLGFCPCRANCGGGIYSQGVALGYGLLGLSDRSSLLFVSTLCFPFAIGGHAVVNLFRNNVNDVRKLSTFPVQRVTNSSGKEREL